MARLVFGPSAGALSPAAVGTLYLDSPHVAKSPDSVILSRTFGLFNASVIIPETGSYTSASSYFWIAFEASALTAR